MKLFHKHLLFHIKVVFPIVKNHHVIAQEADV
jgi:hypothetical protein